MPDTSNAEASLRLANICRENGLRLEEHQVALLSRYTALLLEWNSKVNLISRRDEENVWWSHILHSLSLLFFLTPPEGARILDLGTGGGLPGIPLAIVRNDLHITLLDSIQKKTTAVANMVDQLALPNVQVMTGRAEEIGRKTHGVKGVTQVPAGVGFEIVLARAVAPLEELIRWAKPLLRNSRRMKVINRLPQTPEGGLSTPLLVAMKGGDLEEEIRRARQRAPQALINAAALQFPGSQEIGLEEKRIVTVRL